MTIFSIALHSVTSLSVQGPLSSIDIVSCLHCITATNSAPKLPYPFAYTSPTISILFRIRIEFRTSALVVNLRRLPFIMKFALVSALLAIPAIASAAPTPPPPHPYFTAFTLSQNGQIKIEPFTARDHELWINGKTESHCPSGKNCPAGKKTSLALHDHSLSMGASVPGGQQVYIAKKDGRVKYTAPGENVPQGAYTKGWSVQDQLIHNKYGLFACRYKDTDTYEVYAGIGNFKNDHCLKLAVYYTQTEKPTAYEYL
jgi:hypothetical protein